MVKTNKEQVNPAEKEKNKAAMFTTFLLLSPSVFLTGAAILSSGLIGTVASLCVFAYQAIMIKNYIEKQQTY